MLSWKKSEYRGEKDEKLMFENVYETDRGETEVAGWGLF